MRLTCCCQWQDCAEIAEPSRGKDKIWGVGSFVSIIKPSNSSAKQLAKRQNLVQHFGCSPELKRYNIARHHYAKTLLTANTGKWITPLLPKKAKSHGIMEACDSFIGSGGQRMFVRALIVPRDIARSMANSFVPGTSKFLCRNRQLERSCERNTDNTDYCQEDSNLDNDLPVIQAGIPLSPVLPRVLSAANHNVIANQSCLGISCPTQKHLKDQVLSKDAKFQSALQLYHCNNDGCSCWRALKCTGFLAATSETLNGKHTCCSFCSQCSKKIRPSRTFMSLGDELENNIWPAVSATLNETETDGDHE